MDILTIYKELKDRYGKPKGQWALWCKRPKTKAEKEQVIIESVLTQRANWKNVCYAINNLRDAELFSLEHILHSDNERLRSLIKPSGFYRVKAQRLKDLCDCIINEFGGVREAEKQECGVIRKRLLSLNGIGEETADDILLYALEKPVFVIDEYTRRLVKRYNLSDKFSYKHLQDFFENGLNKRDYRLYQDFHALIVIDGKEYKNR